jgi:hypothetical protein
MARERKSKGKADWRSLVAEQRQSGLTIAAFCRRRKVTEASFYWHKRRFAEARRRATANRTQPSAGLVPVEVVGSAVSAPGACTAELVVRGGRAIRIEASAVDLARLIDELEGHDAC